MGEQNIRKALEEGVVAGLNYVYDICLERMMRGY
jgi:hypothetical protein